MVLPQVALAKVIKGAGLIDNDEHVVDSPTKKLLKMKIPITMKASDALPSSLIDSNVSPRQTQQNNEELKYVPWLAILWR